MHEVEQGSLQWADATQWALNRLSTSQIAMANASQISSQTTAQNKKVCKFYNEGVCSHESLSMIVNFVPGKGKIMYIQKLNAR